METIKEITLEITPATFYPTYEEWKHFSCLGTFHEIIAFYPTYEEWKLEYF